MATKKVRHQLPPSFVVVGSGIRDTDCRCKILVCRIQAHFMRQIQNCCEDASGPESSIWKIFKFIQKLLSLSCVQLMVLDLVRKPSSCVYAILLDADTGYRLINSDTDPWIK